MIAFQRVIEALESRDCTVKRRGDQADAQCPAHDDRTPSLSVCYDRGKGSVLVRCHTGCATEDVTAALGLTMADLFDERPDDRNGRRPDRELVCSYRYTDQRGRLVREKVRYRTPDGKTFRIRHRDQRGAWVWSAGDGPRVLYRLPEVLAAISEGREVWVAEGEKDADRAVEQLGVTATTNIEGAAEPGSTSKWRPEYTQQLRGAKVLIVADNDPAGFAHARAVASTLRGVAERVRVVRPAVDIPKADLSDHLDAGYGLEDLIPLDDPVTDDQPAAPDIAVLVPLSTVQPERLTWLWEGRLPAGKIVLIDGDPSVGKSTLGVELAAHVSTGKPWPDGALCDLGSVLVLSAEDGLADTIRPRLDAAEGDPSRVHALTAVRSVLEDGKVVERPPTLADIGTVEAAIRKIGARMCLIDVMMAFLPGKVDSHKDQDIRAVLSRLTKLGEQTNCTFILLRHLNKASGGSPMYRGGGSIGIVGAARAGYLVARDPDDPETRVVACVKSNLAKEPESLSYRLESAPGSDVARIVWTGVSAHDAAGLLRQDRDEADDRNEADTWLRDLLEANRGGLDAQEVFQGAKAIGLSVDQAKRAKKRLGVQSTKAGMGGGWVWTLPSEGSTKGAKGAASQTPLPSRPSALPSGTSRPGPASCIVCGTAIPEGADACAACFKAGRVSA